MIKIIVCMKVIIDPEMPFSLFQVDSKAMRPIAPKGMPPVISPFDENALEAALKIKDQQECKIVVLSIGRSLPKAIFQKTLAVGADEVIALESPEFENLDPFKTALTLANEIKKLDHYDLIITGRQAADWDAGLVWAGIAEFLDIPSITLAREAKVTKGKVIVERCVSDGIEILESDMPTLVTFSSEAGELRPVSLSALLKVKKREIPKRLASNVEFTNQSLMEIRNLYVPGSTQINCSLIPGESLEEKGRELARRLADEGIILRDG